MTVHTGLFSDYHNFRNYADPSAPGSTVRGDLTQKFLGVCRSAAVRNRLLHPRPQRRTAALLHAMLGGDMRELGPSAATYSVYTVPDGTSTHPALDRIAVQNLASRELKALVELREP